MRAPRLSDERGIALAVAVFALVVIGALVAGTFFAGRLEQQSGRNTIFATQVAEAADAGLSNAIKTGTGTAYSALAIGGVPTTLPALALPNRVGASTRVTRLTSSLFLIQSQGSRTDASGNPLATRSVGALVRLMPANLTVNAGLKARGRVIVSGNSTVSGLDIQPPYWNGVSTISCPPTNNRPGVVYDSTLSQQGTSQILGNPPTVHDSTMTPSNMLGGSTFDQLKALRTLTLIGNISGLAPAVSGTPSVCNTSVQSNWGAPSDSTSPCFTYFPIIYRYGDLSISGTGQGQGILLVEGNLSVQGRIDFFGPVVVTGAVNVRGTGSDNVKFYGGLIAQDVALDDNRLTGNATINYSSCAIKRALQGSALIKPLTERSWAQLY